MDILIIGGTRFLGRYIAQAALDSGHNLTIFHRGKTNPALFPEAKHVRGDRMEGFEQLNDNQFDAVVDTCAYFKRAVDISTDWFKEGANSYLFISSISVYKDTSNPPTEESEVGTIEDETTEEITGESYGPLKAVCERVVREHFPETGIVVRPGIIVGPHDPTDRFTYWPVRFEKGGEVIAPDRKDQPVQIIDVRDVSAFCINLLEQSATGIFNAAGPAKPYVLGDFLEIIRQTVNPAVATKWVPTDELTNAKIEPWSDMPCVLPYDGASDGMFQADLSKSIKSGLSFRPLEETTRDTLDWFHSELHNLNAGLSPEREAEVLNCSAVAK